MAITHRFDDLYRQHAGVLPIAFLRALAEKESSSNPSSVTAGSQATGLLQVVPIVLESYNKRRGTSFSQSDLLRPEINVPIATDLLNRIATAYGKHPDPNMHPDFTNPEFVRLLVAGWNSGYSELGGVGCAARFLEMQGQPVTHAAVFDVAGRAGCTKHLQNTAKRAWQRSVADLYFAQSDAPRSRGTNPLANLLLLPLAILMGIAIAEYK